MATLPPHRRVLLPRCGHMLHHDQPQAVAAAVEEFLETGEPDPIPVPRSD
jgi:pimeloyl-ACP methyl ester carboxylesterase